MNTKTMELEVSRLENALNHREGKYAVKLSNVGNPDYRQDARRKLPGTVCGWAHVDSLKDCSELCLLYIAFFDLGAGNWSGGEVTCSGVVIGRVSYNGAVWDEETGKEVETGLGWQLEYDKAAVTTEGAL